RPRHHQLPDARLADLASTLLGMSDSDRVLQDRRHRPHPGRPTARAASSDEELLAAGHGPLAARERAGVRQHDLPEMRRPGRTRDRYARRLRLLVMVLPAL